MKLRILLFLFIFILTLSACNEKTANQHENYEAIDYEFKSEKARELYKQCLNYDFSNLFKLKESAKELTNIKDDQNAQIIGSYYLLVADFKFKGDTPSLDKVLAFYNLIPERKYDKLRYSIDLLAIGYYYRNFYSKGIAERINLVSQYITRPEHWLERTTFRIYISAQQHDKDYDRLITDFKNIKEELNKYPWGLYHNLIYKSIARTYNRKDDSTAAIAMFEYAKNENIKNDKPVLNISILTEVYYTLGNDIAVLNEAEKIALISGFTLNLSLIYRLKGHGFSNSGDYDKAFELYDTAAKTDSISNKVESYVYSNIYRGWAYYKKNPTRKNYNKSLTYFKLAEQKSDIIKDPKNYLQEIMNRKIWALSDIGTTAEINTVKGEFYNLYYSKLGQKFTASELKRFVANLTIGLSLKKNEVDYLKIAETNNKQKIASQKIILVLGLILLLSLIGFNSHRVKKAQEIKSKNKIINSQNFELQKSIQKLSDNTDVLNKTNFQLQEVLERRDKIIVRLKQFAYTLAHDLSDPLLAIKTFGFLLNKTATKKLDTKETEFLDFILDASNRLNEKVDRLYKYSTNTLILFNDFKVLNVNTIINGIKQDLFISILDKKALIVCDKIPPIRGDEVLINQLFQNLISNALKFSKEDQQPIVKISSYEENNELIIVVKDNGIGIKKTSNTDIFELFERARQDNKTKGKGIGLAIVKETVEAHSGRIWFVSDPDIGTTFYIAFKEYGENIKNGKMFETAMV